MIRQAVVALLALAAPLAAQQQPVAIVGARIHPVSGPVIERGTIVLQGGRITAVGADAAVPTGARVIDGAGRVITPGFIHSETQIGLGVGRSLAYEVDEEYAAIGGTNDDRVKGEVNPSFNPAEGIDPNAIAIPVARLGGVTSTVVVPGRGFLAGQVLVVDLAGNSLEEMTAANPVAVAADLSDNSREAGNGSRAGATARLRALFRDAQVYRTKKLAYESGALRELAAPAAELAALLPVLDRAVPLYVEAHRQSDIQNVLRLTREFRIRVVLRGGKEAWTVADELRKAGIATVIDAYTNLPTFDGLRARWDNAAMLREAGATVILGGQSPGGQANLRFEAGHAVRNGMRWADALAAVTIEPARAFGIATRYGSLEAGKVANVVVWSGDPFETSTAAEHVFIRGAEMPPTSRQVELLNRYRTLPPTY
jgi:imidazolonepropionase-like amidohydrolase